MALIDDYSKYYKIKPATGRFGVEIETEVLYSPAHPIPPSYGDSLVVDLNSGDYKTPSKFWSAKVDNSLRNFGMEFVLKKPHDLKGVELALEEFHQMFGGVDFIEDAVSTSVHVHVNIQQFTPRQLGVFITTWTLFENLFAEFAGETRRSNLFALPMRCAETNLETIVKMFTQIEKKIPSAIAIESGSSKYAALNLSCMRTLGSLEIRLLRGTTDRDVIYTWVSLLDRLVEYCCSFASDGGTPIDILDMYRHSGTKTLLDDIFGGLSDALTNNTFYNQMVERNLFYAAVIADSVSDWGSLDTFLGAEKKPKSSSTAIPLSIPPMFEPLDALNITTLNTSIVDDDDHMGDVED